MRSLIILLSLLFPALTFAANTACDYSSGSICTEFNFDTPCPIGAAVSACPTSNVLGVCTDNDITKEYNWKIFAYLQSGDPVVQTNTWASYCSSAGYLWSASNIALPAPDPTVNPKVTQPAALIASGSFAEPNDTPAEATPILINDKPLFQVFSSVNDEDWFELYAKAGQNYTIEIPATSVGKLINPALELYDAAGNLLMSQVNSGATGQGEQIRWTAPSAGLFRVRITNQPSAALKKPAVEEFKGEAADYTYQVQVYLTNAPQQVLTKGRVLDNCAQGVNEAKVSALLGSVLSDSTTTNKFGEFGLLLNPGAYNLKILATNYQDASQSVVVGQDATILADIKLLSTTTGGCALNPLSQSQQTPVFYDDQQGILIIRDIVIDSKTVYYVELKNIGDFRFQLFKYLSIPGVIHANPPQYISSTSLATFPEVFALARNWKIQLKHAGNGVFTVNAAAPY